MHETAHPSLRRRALVAAAVAAALVVVPVAHASLRAEPRAVAAPLPSLLPSPEPSPAPVVVAAVRAAASPSGEPSGAVARTGTRCTALPGFRLCTHGDDPRPAAGQGDEAPASTESTRIGCYGSGRSGPRVQTVYARPAGAPDRLPELLRSFRGWAGAVDRAVDDSARQTGGTRHVRFATRPAGGGCDLDVLGVTLAADAFTSFEATVQALRRQGLDDPSRKYLVWADASRFCGLATVVADSRPGPENAANGSAPSYARIDRACWGRVETHELVHMLGGVQPDAPRATAGHHCRDGRDVMCYADGTRESQQSAVCPPAQARLLDCGSDDYFAAGMPRGTWLMRHWNVASSAFLARTLSEPEPRASPSPQQHVVDRFVRQRDDRTPLDRLLDALPVPAA